MNRVTQNNLKNEEHAMNGGLRIVWLFAIILGGLSSLFQQAPLAAAESEPFHPAQKMAEQINNGQDITRPVTRFDMRYQFMNVPGGHRQNIVTFRGDGAVKFSDKWELALRGDIPVVYGDVPTDDNSRSRNQLGLGDILTQAVAVYVVSHRVAIGAGLQLTLPTATNDQSGTGKAVALPLAGVRMSLPEISNGSFFLPYARYATSFAGNSNRIDVSRFEFAPCLNIMLPMRNFVVFYPNPEIVYDYKQSNSWTVPFDIMLGRMFTDKLVGSVEIFTPMFESKNYNRPYNFKIEARLGFFF